MDNRALGALGLAMRAGAVTSGDALTEREARAGRAAVVLLDGGASANTREKYESLCRGREIPLIVLEAGALAGAIGRDGRVVACVKRGGLAEKLLTLLAATT